MLTQCVRRAVQELPGIECGDWFILRTRARQEKVVCDDLAARSIGTFLPLVRRIRYHNGRKGIADLPLFPGYVFLRGSRDDAYAADRTRRIAQIIGVANQAGLDMELQSLHVALAHKAPLDPYPYLAKGVLVEVRAGPFRGVRGLVVDRYHGSLLILQVEMLGRAVSLEIDASLLEPLDAPRPAPAARLATVRRLTT
jgi:transcription antitermination factor NusG